MFAIIVILSLIAAAPMVFWAGVITDKAVMSHFKKYGNGIKMKGRGVDVSAGHW